MLRRIIVMIFAVFCLAISAGHVFAQDEEKPADSDAAAPEDNAAEDTPKAVTPQLDVKESYLHFISLLQACGTFEDESARPSDLPECSLDAIWDSIDVQSKLIFVNAYSSLVRINRIIETYFDPIEFKHMRKRTGTDILIDKDITDAKKLFEYMFRPKEIVFNKGTISGMQFIDYHKSKDNEFIAIIETNYRDGDYIMIRESDNVWRMAGLRNIFESAVAPIFASEKAMQEFAKDNLLEEIKRRQNVQKHFMVQQAIRKEYMN